MKDEELVGSLQIYELSLPQPKKKIMTLKSSRKKLVDSSNEDSTNSEEIAMLGKEFRKFLRFYNGTSKNPLLDLSNGDSQGVTQGNSHVCFFAS
jgi:hypothetical protein